MLTRVPTDLVVIQTIVQMLYDRQQLPPLLLREINIRSIPKDPNYGVARLYVSQTPYMRGPP